MNIINLQTQCSESYVFAFNHPIAEDSIDIIRNVSTISRKELIFVHLHESLKEYAQNLQSTSLNLLNIVGLCTSVNLNHMTCDITIYKDTILSGNFEDSIEHTEYYCIPRIEQQSTFVITHIDIIKK